MDGHGLVPLVNVLLLTIIEVYFSLKMILYCSAGLAFLDILMFCLKCNSSFGAGGLRKFIKKIYAELGYIGGKGRIYVK
jgi:hypothetical protein